MVAFGLAFHAHLEAVAPVDHFDGQNFELPSYRVARPVSVGSAASLRFLANGFEQPLLTNRPLRLVLLGATAGASAATSGSAAATSHTSARAGRQVLTLISLRLPILTVIVTARIRCRRIVRLLRRISGIVLALRRYPLLFLLLLRRGAIGRTISHRRWTHRAHGRALRRHLGIHRRIVTALGRATGRHGLTLARLGRLLCRLRAAPTIGLGLRALRQYRWALRRHGASGTVGRNRLTLGRLARLLRGLRTALRALGRLARLLRGLRTALRALGRLARLLRGLRTALRALRRLTCSALGRLACGALAQHRWALRRRRSFGALSQHRLTLRRLARIALGRLASGALAHHLRALRRLRALRHGTLRRHRDRGTLGRLVGTRCVAPHNLAPASGQPPA